MAYDVPAAPVECELEVKKSRFIARLLPVSCREDVNAAVAQARSDYPDARHHCYAYLIGPPASAHGAGMSDDGEPGGTAGKPILNVLQHGHLGDVLVIVICYFGGIKLGAGGLVRSYGAAAKLALDNAPIEQRKELQTLRLMAGFGQEQALRHQLSQLGGDLLDVSYGDGVAMQVQVDAEAAITLSAYCAGQGISIAGE